MVERDKPHTPSPSPGGDGVRVIPKARAAGRSAPFLVLGVLVLLGVAVVWRLLAPGAPEREVAANAPPTIAPAAGASAAPRPMRAASAHADEPLPNDDPNDLANYFRPGDAEPTGAELIGALNDVGIRTGIGAFNPPGTSPPLEGIAVPEDFELPEGYARHTQWTDEGVAIEPILMFAPDFQLYDAHGRPIPMPDNRVVPPELAPPGLPPRRVRIPPPT